LFARIAGLELVGAAVTAAAVSRVYTIGVVTVEVVVLLAGAWLLIRGKQASQAISNARASQELASEWRENYLAERSAREDAAREAAEQRELKHAALNEAAALRAQTDLTAVMTALIEIQKTGTKSADVLDKISRRLDRIDPPIPARPSS
jgi:hypothetical protein